MSNVRDYFNQAYSTKQANEHEWVAGTASPELIDLVWRKVIPTGSEVLEVGCGIGTESVFLSVRGMKVTGIDISSSAIEKAQKLAEVYNVKPQFSVEDVINLPFEDNSFDTVCDQGCFHHLTDEERKEYTKEISRVLKKDGLLILRCFSDAIPGGPQPRRIKSDELIQTLQNDFILEELKRVLSFSTEQRDSPLGWSSIWVKRQ